LFGSGEHCSKVVARVAQAARRHVAVEQINVADESGVEERSLVERRFPSTDQCTAAGRAEFFEPLAQRLERTPRERGDGATETVQDIALVELSNVRLEIFRMSGFCKGRDALNRCALLFCMRVRNRLSDELSHR
jgi:hypothetical protein